MYDTSRLRNIRSVYFRVEIEVLKETSDKFLVDVIPSRVPACPRFSRLTNEGMTGSVNTVLQLLYCIKPFRDVSLPDIVIEMQIDKKNRQLPHLTQVT